MKLCANVLATVMLTGLVSTSGFAADGLIRFPTNSSFDGCMTNGIHTVTVSGAEVTFQCGGGEGLPSTKIKSNNTCLKLYLYYDHKAKRNEIQDGIPHFSIDKSGVCSLQTMMRGCPVHAGVSQISLVFEIGCALARLRLPPVMVA
jgi:hypothetical protein